MGTVLDIRAKEMAHLRDTNRQLQTRLTTLENIVRDNDALVETLHRLSVLLIARADGWRGKAELLLRRGTKASAADIYICSSAFAEHAGLVKKIMRLPAGGRADEVPLVGQTATGATYYHLPIKTGRAVTGLLTLSFRQKALLRDGDNHFCLRLAALLSAAINADG